MKTLTCFDFFLGAISSLGFWKEEALRKAAKQKTSKTLRTRIMATEVIYPRLSKGSRFQASYVLVVYIFSIHTFYAQDAYPPPSLRPSLASLDSAFQLQEYISLLIRLDVHDVEGIVSLPGKAENDVDSKDNEEDKAVDEACWIYEQLRYAHVANCGHLGH
jgi:hypothetical protein